MIDKDKTYQTRCGYPVVIHAVYPGQEWAVHGVYCEGGIWFRATWALDGAWWQYAASDLDLIEVAPAQTYYVNQFEDGSLGEWHDTQEDADGARDGDRVALWKITIKGNTMTGEKVEA